MKLKIKLLSALACTIFILTAQCSLEHYSADREVRLDIEFPGRATVNNNNLLRPEGTDTTYIPPFVDRIKIIPSSEDCGETLETNRYPENSLSNKFELTWDYSDCSFTVDAYTCFCKPGIADCSLCPEADQVWAKTHTGYFSTSSIDSSGVETTVAAKLSIVKGHIDPDAIPVGLSSGFSTDTVTQYCLDIDNEGYFGFAWHPNEASATLNKLSSEVHPPEVYPPAGSFLQTSDIEDDNMINSQVGSCLLRGENFYTTSNIYDEVVDPVNIVMLLTMPKRSGTANFSAIEFPPMTVASLGNFPNSMDSAEDISALAWIDNQSTKMAIFDNETFSYNDKTSVMQNLCSTCNEIMIQIISKNRIVVLAHDGSIFHLISVRRGSDGTWHSTQAIPTGDADADTENGLYYSLLHMPDERFLLMYQTVETTDKMIKGIFINPVFTAFEGSSFDLYGDAPSPTGDKRHPSLALYGDAAVISWAMQVQPAPAAIYYGYLKDDGTLDTDTVQKVFENSESNDSIIPKIAVNDDGFGLIS